MARIWETVTSFMGVRFQVSSFRFQVSGRECCIYFNGSPVSDRILAARKNFCHRFILRVRCREFTRIFLLQSAKISEIRGYGFSFPVKNGRAILTQRVIERIKCKRAQRRGKITASYE